VEGVVPSTAVYIPGVHYHSDSNTDEYRHADKDTYAYRHAYRNGAANGNPYAHYSLA